MSTASFNSAATLPSTAEMIHDSVDIVLKSIVKDEDVRSTEADPTAAQTYLKKRYWIDRAVAAVLLLVTAPLLLVLMAIIRLTSKGAAVYSQTRVGLNGRNFTIYKLRSMAADAESGRGAVWCTPGDPRVTSIGRFLRWSHLDELPQLVNILRGEMALIGPRPERPEFVEQLAKEVPFYRRRLDVVPGVTGLAQVTLPPDSDLSSVRRKTIMDREYIESASASLDIHILFCTVMLAFGLQRKLDVETWQSFA